MKKLWMIGLGAYLATACVDTTKNPEPVHREPTGSLRQPTAQTTQAPRLIYVTYQKDGTPQRQEITPSQWKGENHGFSSGGREDYLLKMYYSNTRNLSLRNIRHASCFYGEAESVRQAFFAEGDPALSIRNIRGDWVKTKASSDGSTLGFLFEYQNKGEFTFRLTHCDAGKSPITGVSMEDRSPSAAAAANVEKPVAPKPVSERKFDASYGFMTLDQATGANLPQFKKIRGDYDKAFDHNENLPWAGLNVKDPREAVLIALRAQKYFYENMANQDKRPDFNFIAENNKSRYWCHMPWMNVGLSGREAIHGLTQERDLQPSSTLPSYAKPTAGTDWGIGYFNSVGCRTLNAVYGSESNPKAEPDFSKNQFENGTMVTKILFTAADFPEIKDAFTWTANATDVGSNQRSLRPVRHIQMDMAIKDNSLKGVNPLLSNWIMIGFYYDPDYDYDRDLKPITGEENPLKQIPNLPKAFLKMRPMGLQIGFESAADGDTITFAGSKTNGWEGRLNGPADNPKSSCLSCHGTAGTKVFMSPGFMSNEAFKPYQNAGLDFNQQMTKAKSNFETQMKK